MLIWVVIGAIGAALGQSPSCLRVTHTFVDAAAPPRLDSDTLISNAAPSAECRNATATTTLTMRLSDSSSSCALTLNISRGVSVEGGAACDGGVVTLLGALSRPLYILGLRFDAASFRSGGVLRAGAFVGRVARLDDDGSWNAFEAAVNGSSASSSSVLLVSAFNLSLPLGVALQSVALRVPSADDLAPSSLAPPANFTALEPQSWAEANSALAIGLGALGIFVLLTVGFFAAVFVWNKRRKANAARNELALYGVGASGVLPADRKRRSSLTDVVMIDAADDRVQRAKSAHALLAQSTKNQDAPSVRYEASNRDDLFKSAQQ